MAQTTNEEKSLQSFALSDGTTHMNTQGKKNLSGAQKRKKKKEKEELAKELAADVERLKLGPTELWTGLVLHQ